MPRFRLLLPVLLLVLIAAPVGIAARTATTVTVTASDFKFKLSTTHVKAGTVTFRVINGGKIAHDFRIAGTKTPMIKPGKSATLTLVLKRGRYPFLCTVPGHAKLGMKGVLVVT
jgi:nitrite reductase (NO-forming)